MSRQHTRLGAIALAAALCAVVAIGASGIASAKKKARPLRVSCDEVHAEVFKSAKQLQAQYNAMGFTIEDGIENILVGSACTRIGTPPARARTRRGTAYMADIHYSGDGSPPFPGETNTDIRAYYWTWTVTVTRTKKGRLVDTISPVTCTKETSGGSDAIDYPC